MAIARAWTTVYAGAAVWAGEMLVRKSRKSSGPYPHWWSDRSAGFGMNGAAVNAVSGAQYRRSA